MNGAEQKYIEDIQKKDSTELLSQWKSYLDGSLKVSIWEPGKLFEYTVLRAFQLEGSIVRWPYSVRLNDETIEQIDGSVSFKGYHILLECKDHSNRINIEPIAKMRNQLLQRPAIVIGCIFSRSGYTEPAIALSRFCAPQTILLWENDELMYCIEHKKLIEAFELKLMKAAQEFVYNYNVRAYFTTKDLQL